MDRDNEVTKTYAQAAIGVANRCGVPVVDLWTELQRALPEDGWKSSLYDGLHIGPDAAEVLFKLIVDCIAA
jgi:lysophospholipase L1-like esterase